VSTRLLLEDVKIRNCLKGLKLQRPLFFYPSNFGHII